MKKKYLVLAMALLGVNAMMYSQSLPANINFTTAEGFVNNTELNADVNWTTNADWHNHLYSGATWGYQRVTGNWARTAWQTPVVATAGQVVKLRLDFDPSSGTAAASTALFAFGMMDASGAPDLSTVSHQEVYVKTDASTKYILDAQTTGTSTSVIGTRFYVVSEFIIGASAASSSILSRLYDSSNTVASDVSTKGSFPADLYTAITGSGGYVFFVSQGFKSGGGFQRLDFSKFQVSVESESVLSNKNVADIDFSIYPNPVKNTLNVQSEEEIASLQVSNMLGQNVLSQNGGTSVNTSSLSKGVYLITVTLENGAVSTKRFVKGY